MAQLKDSVVQGSLRVTDTLYTTNLNLSSATASQIVKTDANKNLISGALTSTEIPSLSITDKTTGTLPVSRGGTGAESFTVNCAIVSNASSTTGALTTRGILNNTSGGALGWNSSGVTHTDNLRFMTVNTLAYWNGAHSGTSSNLAYCNKGAFGNMAIKTVGTGFSDSSNTLSIAYGTAASTSLQGNQVLFKLNNADKTASSAASFYAPTGGGTAGQYLKAVGATSTPTWETFSASTVGLGNVTNDTQVKASLGTTAGDILYWSGSPVVPTRFAGNTTNTKKFLTMTSSTPAWVEIYEIPTGGTQGQALIKSSNSDGAVTWGAVGGVMKPTTNTATAFYVTGSESNLENTADAVFDTAVYIQNSKLFGAAWNDYAEFRETTKPVEPGRCIVENGDGTLSLSTERMQAGAEIVSDTFGFAIGETDKCRTPIAVSGRVLAYMYDRTNVKIGAPVCSGPNGTVSQMTEQEARDYPWLIIGTISAIPQEKTWGSGNVQVDNRIWIRVR